MNHLIRNATQNDHSEIVEMQLAMAFESEGMKLDLETLQKGVSAVLNDSNKGTYLIAELDKKISGMLLCIPEWSDWRNGTVIWIHSVFVKPESRRNGTYRALYSHLKSQVETSPNLRGLRLYVEKNNLKAQETYRKLGMRNDHYDLYEWMKDFL
ncbi:MAG: GNAT family N-acetyltransferase [Proteobacteria bacterium]|nr:GNAT family N-acetyltransferase [Pseudomonadota bacterium]